MVENVIILNGELREKFKTVQFRSHNWLWPADDEKLLQVNEWVDDLDVALTHTPGRRIAVQAGGATGIWPSELAHHFDVVYTFEPHPVNFTCLAANCSNPNIIKIQAALDAEVRFIDLTRDTCEDGNAGAHYVAWATETGKTPALPLDIFELRGLDFLQLDVEGFEIMALQGAYETIMVNRPVIMVEAKQLPHMESYPGIDKNTAVEFLIQEAGYKVVENLHRDVVLVPEHA